MSSEMSDEFIVGFMIGFSERFQAALDMAGSIGFGKVDLPPDSELCDICENYVDDALCCSSRYEWFISDGYLRIFDNHIRDE